jgi:transketolase
MPLQSLKDKYESFGWTAIEINGHDIAAFVEAVVEASKTVGRPTVIVANTILGSGVSFMENDYRWHGQAPNAEQGERALVEIRRHLAEI